MLTDMHEFKKFPTSWVKTRKHLEVGANSS